MSQPHQSNKRIVSKTEYAVLMSKKAMLLLIGNLMSGWAILGGCFIGFSLLCVIPIMWLGQWRDDPGVNPGVINTVIVVGGCVGFICIQLHRIGVGVSQKAHRMAEVIPQTRYNTRDLPVSESLVRASSEPVQEQEIVLLRAFVPCQSMPVEQLLRPMGELPKDSGEVHS